MLSFNSAHLRLLWGVVETHRHRLQGLSDDAINFWIVKNIRERLYLTDAEIANVQAYITERMNLIRDIVERKE